VWRLLGVAVFGLSSANLLREFLVYWPDEIWQVDLEVYREGASSLIEGRQVYDWLTTGPQWLPFTYPPFSAVLLIPLAMIPFRAAAWCWELFQLYLLWVCVGITFRRFLDRFGERALLIQGAVAGLLVHTLPISDGLRFGQVNSVIVTLCLLDVSRRQAVRWPRGTLVAVAAAIKLTPAVFWLHWAARRRWRVLATSIGTAAGLTVLTGLLAPSASAAFWGEALLDPNRLGPNDGTSNQSMRGVLLRLLGGSPTAVSAVWLVLTAAVLAFGLWLAGKFEQAGQPVAVVAVIGLVAFLVSPVSWIHHLQWLVVVVGVLLGDGGHWRQWVLSAISVTVLWMKLPWWGTNRIVNHNGPVLVARLLENSYDLYALLALVALWAWVYRVGEPAVGDQIGEAASLENEPSLENSNSK
jgi:alpha-1,2-mannosyltransferase